MLMANIFIHMFILIGYQPFNQPFQPFKLTSHPINIPSLIQTIERSPFYPTIPQFEQEYGPLIELPDSVEDFVRIFITDEVLMKI